MYSIIYTRCIFFLKTMYFRVGQLPKSVTKSSWSALGLVSSPKINCPTRICELVSSQNGVAQLVFWSWSVSIQNCAAQLVFWSWSAPIIALPNSCFRVGQLPKLPCPTRFFDLISSENSALPNSYFASWSAPKITLPNSCFRVGQLRKLCSDQL